MEHFLKKFTVIDFLGIFVPGGIVVVAFNQYFGGVAAPFTALFGEQPAVLVLYIVFLSYFVGILLQELSKPLESLLLCKINVDENRQNETCVKECYQKYFHADLDVVRRSKTATELGRDIYLYVKSELEQTKMPLFHAFASMGRTCCASAVAVLLMNLYACKLGLASADVTFVTPILCLLALLLMAYRCRRFHKIMREYVYSTFVKQPK